MFDRLVKTRLVKLLDKIHHGQITITTPEGDVITAKGANDGYNADIILHDWRVVANLVLKGDVGFAADYRDGYFETSDLLNLICFGLQNESFFENYAYGNVFFKLLSKLLYLTKRNSLKGSRRNIQAHYDLGNNFYQLWLDPSMTYSAAIFQSEREDITTAQYQKYDRLLDKIKEPSARILEIGCGWGGFAERAVARNHSIKGITLSQEQASYAQKRLENTKAQIAIEDYRHQEGSYDYIVSIEMLEAVGKKYWPIYFKKLKSLLKPSGKILLQTITIEDKFFDQYAKNADMIRTYIFPGGMLPSEEKLQNELHNAGLKCDETFRFGNDYALTLKIWLDKFKSKINEVKNIGFNDSFTRLWEFYLCACIAGFNSQRINVVQMEISHVTSST